MVFKHKRRVTMAFLYEVRNYWFEPLDMYVTLILGLCSFFPHTAAHTHIDWRATACVRLTCDDVFSADLTRPASLCHFATTSSQPPATLNGPRRQCQHSRRFSRLWVARLSVFTLLTRTIKSSRPQSEHSICLNHLSILYIYIFEFSSSLSIFYIYFLCLFCESEPVGFVVFLLWEVLG